MSNTNIKYSIIFPYYKRPQIIDTSLMTLQKWYSNRRNYEVIFIMDLKNTTADRDIFFSKLHPFWDKMRIVVLNNDVYTYNSCRAYNVAAKHALGEFLVITNPECIHKTDILSGLDNEFSKNIDSYVICACESINSDGTFIQWYQHSQFNNRLLHFCSSISKDNYMSLGGFDEDYIYGVAYEDDEWRECVIKSGKNIIIRDDLIVSHIEHPREYLLSDRVEKNRALYISKRAR